MADSYHIRVKGHLDPTWSAWFDGLTIINEANGDAVLAGLITDQAALHGVLLKVRDLGLPLIAVQLMAMDVEDSERGDRPASSANAPGDSIPDRADRPPAPIGNGDDQADGSRHTP